MSELLECATRYPVNKWVVLAFGVVIGVITILLRLAIMRDVNREKRAKLGDNAEVESVSKYLVKASAVMVVLFLLFSVV